MRFECMNSPCKHRTISVGNPRPNTRIICTQRQGDQFEHFCPSRYDAVKPADHVIRLRVSRIEVKRITCVQATSGFITRIHVKSEL